MKMRYLLILAVLTGLMISGASASSGDDINLNRIEKSFWDNGNVRLMRYYSLSGILRETSFYDESGVLVKLIKYDESGNRIAMSYYNPDGSLKATAEGWAVVRWEYRFDRLFRARYFNDKGILIDIKEFADFGNVFGDKSDTINDIKDFKEIKKPTPIAGSETLSY